MASWAETVAAAALNDGSSYSNAASKTLSDASDTLDRYIQGQNKTVELAKNIFDELVTGTKDITAYTNSNALFEATKQIDGNKTVETALLDELTEQSRKDTQNSATNTINNSKNAIFGSIQNASNTAATSSEQQTQQQASNKQQMTKAPSTGDPLNDYAYSDEWKGNDLNAQFKQIGDQARLKVAAEQAQQNIKKDIVQKTTGGKEPSEIADNITLNASNITYGQVLEATRGTIDPRTGKAWDQKFYSNEENPLESLDQEIIMEALVSPDRAKSLYLNNYMNADQYRAIIALTGVNGMRENAKQYWLAKYQLQEAENGNFTPAQNYELAKQLKEAMGDLYKHKTVQDVFDDLTAVQNARQGLSYQTALKREQSFLSDLNNMFNTGKASQPTVEKKEPTVKEQDDDKPKDGGKKSESTSVSKSYTYTKKTNNIDGLIESENQAVEESVDEDYNEPLLKAESNKNVPSNEEEYNKRKDEIRNDTNNIVQFLQGKNFLAASTVEILGEQAGGYRLVPGKTDDFIKENKLNNKLFSKITSLVGANRNYGKGIQKLKSSTSIYPDIEDDFADFLLNTNINDIKSEIVFLDSEIPAINDEEISNDLKLYRDTLKMFIPLAEKIQELYSDTSFARVTTAETEYSIEEDANTLVEAKKTLQELNKQMLDNNPKISKNGDGGDDRSNKNTKIAEQIAKQERIIESQQIKIGNRYKTYLDELTGRDTKDKDRTNQEDIKNGDKVANAWLFAVSGDSLGHFKIKAKDQNGKDIEIAPKNDFAGTLYMRMKDDSGNIGESKGHDFFKEREILSMVLAFEKSFPGQGYKIVKEIWSHDILSEKQDDNSYKLTQEGQRLYDLLRSKKTSSPEELNAYITAGFTRAVGDVLSANNANWQTRDSNASPNNVSSATEMMNRILAYSNIGWDKEKKEYINLSIDDAVAKIRKADQGKMDWKKIDDNAAKTISWQNEYRENIKK